MLGIFGLEFDGDFQIGFGVDALVDLAEGSFVDLPEDLVVFSYLFGDLRH